jgi:hypothetical protein
MKYRLLIAVLTYSLSVWGEWNPAYDLDENSVISIGDLILFADSWMGSGSNAADFDGNESVEYADFGMLAGNWGELGPMPEPENMIWVAVSDPGVPGRGGFTGYISRYETTNSQYCQYLNAALARDEVYVDQGKVYGNTGDYAGKLYFSTYAASSYSQIDYSADMFTVRSRDGYSMADHPVVMVSWYGARAFCNAYGWRLPTEWQWQAVADYNGSFTYGCGLSISKEKANSYQFGFANPQNLSSYPYTNSVDFYVAYGYGVNDMAGNVWEWTSSSSGSAYVMRGGSWMQQDRYCTVSYFGEGDYPHAVSYEVGFRAVK